jgi:pyridoxine/pyridoxamine 5'-phosphate oxidase
LADFHKKVEDSKPKKWSSNRLKSRKNLENKKDVTTRRFNPRNPPRPRSYKKNKNNKDNDKDNFNKKYFPKLK